MVGIVYEIRSENGEVKIEVHHPTSRCWIFFQKNGKRIYKAGRAIKQRKNETSSEWSKRAIKTAQTWGFFEDYYCARHIPWVDKYRQA